MLMHTVISTMFPCTDPEDELGVQNLTTHKQTHKHTHTHTHTRPEKSQSCRFPQEYLYGSLENHEPTQRKFSVGP